MVRCAYLVLSGLALTLLSGSAAVAQERKEPKKYSTPQEVFTAAAAAVQRKDMKSAMTCFTPESRDAMAGMMIFMGQLVLGFSELDPKGKDKANELKAIMEKYGLTKDALDSLKGDHIPKGGDPKDPAKEKAAFAELGKLVKKDRNGFIADMIKFLSKEPGNDKSLIPDAARLEGVTIDGEHAKGMVVGNDKGKEKRDPIEFKKTAAAGWRIDLPAKEFKIEFGGPKN